MRFGFWSGAKRGLRAERGAIAVEFALILPVLMLLVFGAIDFGHYWYVSHVMSDASREGARYGTRYLTHFDAIKGTVRTLPGAISPTVTNYIMLKSNENNNKGGFELKYRLPTETPNVALSGAAATETDPSKLAGEDFVVTVTATKTWWVLGSIPWFGSSKLLTVKTTMTCE